MVKSVSENLFASALAAAVARTATAPLERIKVLQQVQGLHNIGTSHLHSFAIFKHLLRTDSIWSLWRGNGVNILRIAPAFAIRYACFQQYQSALRSVFATPGRAEKDGGLWLVRLLSGGLAGMTAAVFTYPLDLIRLRLTIQTPGH